MEDPIDLELEMLTDMLEEAIEIVREEEGLANEPDRYDTPDRLDPGYDQ